MKINFKFIVSIVCVVLALILVASSFTIISPTQRGIMITLGKSGDTVLTPGLNAHIPLVQRVAKYDLAPKNIDLNFTPGQDAAVTLDMQSVACSMSVYWTYDESRLIDAVTRYSSASIKSLIEKNSLGAIKEVVGEYSIYDIVEKQGEVTSKVYTSLSNRLKDCPVTITNVTIGNWDWSAASVVSMVPVHSHEGMFWAVRYMTTNTEFKFCAIKEWNGDFCTLGTNEGFVTPGNNKVEADGLYTIIVDLLGDKVTVMPAEIYGMGPCFGDDKDWYVGKHPFTNGTTATATLVADGDLRMYAKIPGNEDNWWQSEFNIYDGKIVYRATGGDQAAVPATAGQTVELDFNAGTGSIK